METRSDPLEPFSPFIPHHSIENERRKKRIILGSFRIRPNLVPRIDHEPGHVHAHQAASFHGTDEALDSGRVPQAVCEFRSFECLARVEEWVCAIPLVY